MGNNEENKSSKTDKSTSPAPIDPNGMHAYPPHPDWAAMQAFYGARIPLPQYYNSAYPVGHPPHPYMWGPPQAMMPPFAAPYAAMYSHGGVYAHQGVPAGSPKLGLGAQSTLPAADALPATALSIQTPGKTSGNTTGGSAGSESGDSRGSSEGSGEKTTSGGDQSYGKRKREHSLDLEKTVKLEIQANAVVPADANLTAGMVTGIAVGTAVNGKLENVTGLEVVNSKMSFDAQQSGSKLSSETRFQSERQLKQERRKQSNRESARRSRLRKQAETEELAAKVDVLMAENMNLKSEINELVKSSDKLKLENVRMMEKLKTAKLEKAERIGSNNVDDNRNQTLSTENLLSRVNNSGSVVTQEEEGEMYSNNNSNTTKLRQLLDASPRTDAVAAT